MKPCITLFLIVLLSLLLNIQTKPIYQDAAAPVNERVQDLLSKMTLQEKVNQLLLIFSDAQQTEKLYGVDGVGLLRYDIPPETADPKQTIERKNALQEYMMNHTRLSIPIGFYMEALHSGGRHGTVFPMPCGMGPTWNETLIEEIYDVIGREARVAGGDMAFSSVLNLFTDPRFGRQQEGFTEDPVLLSSYARASVTGLQGGYQSFPNTYLNHDYILSLAKHFAAYGQTSGGLNASPSDISLQRLYEIYLAPWKEYFNSGGRGLMVAHNTINGVPCHGNEWLLQQVLRNEFGWKEGVTMSDANDIDVLVQFNYASSLEDAAIKGLTAGVDIDLGAKAYVNLVQAVKDGKVSEAILNRSVSNVLRYKFATGIFDNPYTDPSKVDFLDNPAHRALARRAAEEGIVLLKNDGVLPLDKTKLKSVAVIGPNANDPTNQLGSYTQPGAKVVTVFDAIKNDLGEKADVKYAQGAQIDSNDTSLIPAAVALAQSSDISILVLGDSLSSCGEWKDRDDLNLFGSQQLLLERVLNANQAMKKKTIVILIHGRTVTFGEKNHLLNGIDALFSAWRPGEEGGNAVWNLITGAANPSGKLARSWVRSVGQIGGPSNPWYFLTPGKWLANFKNHYRKYQDGPSTPLFPFGFGLSYSSFSFSSPSVSPSSVSPNSTVTLSVQVKNTGSVGGSEVVQVYVSFPVSSIVRYWKWLAGWKKVNIAPQQTVTVSIPISVSKLGYYDPNMKYQIQKGEYTLMIGSDSQSASLTTSFTVA